MGNACQSRQLDRGGRMVGMTICRDIGLMLDQSHTHASTTFDVLRFPSIEDDALVKVP
jgi:hypothetical protein